MTATAMSRLVVGIALVLAVLPSSTSFRIPHAFLTENRRGTQSTIGLRTPPGLSCVGRVRGGSSALSVSMTLNDEGLALAQKDKTLKLPDPVIGRRGLGPLVMGGIAAASSLSSAFPEAARAAPASSKGRVLVVGATGGIGQGACQVLLQQGYEVRGLTRDVPGIKKYANEYEWVANVDWYAGDLKKPETLQTMLKGIDYVIFAPGARAYAEGKENNKLIFADAVTTVAKLAKQEGVKHFVMISSGGIRTWEKFDKEDYLYEVLKWKAKGEDNLKASGLTYSIVRIYLFARRKQPDVKNIRITQGDPDGAAAGVTYQNLAVVMERCLTDPAADNVTFEISDANPPDGEFWETTFKKLKKDA